jgi:orotate phosphoribosyltransferase
MNRLTHEWISAYEDRQALFMHDGNMKRRHPKLRSGLHSAGFFNSRPIIEDRKLLFEGACDLLELFAQNGGNILGVDCVVGPQTGATELAKLLCHRVCILTRHECYWASPAKHQEGDVQSMVFNPEEFAMLNGKRVLLCEDVMTTGSSVNHTVHAITTAGGIVLPYALTLVNRSGLGTIDGRRITALISRSLPTWREGECPLCARGSHAVANPKDHWDELTSLAA